MQTTIFFPFFSAILCGSIKISSMDFWSVSNPNCSLSGLRRSGERLMATCILSRNLCVFATSSSKADEVCFRMAFPNISQKSQGVFALNTSVKTYMMPSLSESLITFLTRDVFPHRLGEMIKVFIPLSKFALSLADSNSLSVNISSPTGFPKLKTCSMLQIFFWKQK